MLPPFGLNFTALSMRFSQTCRRILLTRPDSRLTLYTILSVYSAYPSMALMGVLNSWETLDTKSI